MLDEQDKEWIEDRLTARLRDVETNILRAFYGWSRTNDGRINGLTNKDTNLETRLGIAEDRITELERRLGESHGTGPTA